MFKGLSTFKNLETSDKRLFEQSNKVAELFNKADRDGAFEDYILVDEA